MEKDPWRDLNHKYLPGCEFHPQWEGAGGWVAPAPSKKIIGKEHT